MPIPPGASPAQLRAASAAARRVRAEWLLHVTDGTRTVVDVFTAASERNHRPLLLLRLVDVLAAQPDWAAARAERVVTRVRHALGADGLTNRSVTVGWVLDNRASQGRFDAVLDAVDASNGRTAPWAGFPFAAAS